MASFGEIICAPATSVGSGAVSVIRVSGAGCLALVDSLVAFRRGNAAASKGYELKYGVIEGVDDVLVSLFRGPHSYTGEDSVEIGCHASAFIAGEILDRLCALGCRLAEPGEFTRRAFLNGKMDLAQAEAVADVIASADAASHAVALNQMRGGYSAELASLRAKMVELSALLELELDFSEEDVEFADRSSLLTLLDSTLLKVSSLADSFRLGNAIKNGVPVAIVGEPNCGKSTLLNRLVGEQRAIVSDIAGTTRDTIEECVVVGGIRFRFIDTAGIRETSDVVEGLGVERSFDAMRKADVVLAVVDSSLEDGSSLLSEIDSHLQNGQKLIVVYNKSDIAASRASDCACGPCPAVHISALTGDGMEDLLSALLHTQDGRDRFGATLVTNARHHQALLAARTSLLRVRDGLTLGIPTDLIAQDLRESIAHLGTITGEISTNEVLGEIFAKFCIGK